MMSCLIKNLAWMFAKRCVFFQRFSFSPLLWGILQATEMAQVPCAGGLQGQELQRLLSKHMFLVLV